jgi:hypothetical protein
MIESAGSISFQASLWLLGNVLLEMARGPSSASPTSQLYQQTAHAAGFNPILSSYSKLHLFYNYEEGPRPLVRGFVRTIPI